MKNLEILKKMNIINFKNSEKMNIIKFENFGKFKILKKLILLNLKIPKNEYY